MIPCSQWTRMLQMRMEINGLRGPLRRRIALIPSRASVEYIFQAG